MSYGDHRLFLYEDIIDIVVHSDGIYVDNRPMNNKKLIAHKGINNEILFNIRDRDRKLQNVFSDVLMATLINPSTKRRVFYRLLEHTSDVGKVKLTLENSDLQSVDAGIYTMYVSRTDQDGIEHPVFTNQNNAVKFDIEITDQLGMEPVETQVGNTFTQTASVDAGDSANIFVSSAFSGNQDRNFQTALHTIAIYPDAYTGNITVQGSCVEGTPENDDASIDWFDLETLTLTSESNIINKNYQVNSNWIRLIHTPSSGNISQVHIRN